MKLVSFVRNGIESFGAVIDFDGVIDLRKALGDKYINIKSVLVADALGELQESVIGRTADFLLSEVQLLPVIPNPGKIWCCGLNYGEHVRETNREVNVMPTFFLRFSDSLVAHDEPIVCPKESTMLDYEAEVAVIIGKPGRRISEQNAWDHVAGYACFNDATIRDWQRHSQQWGPGKNFWKTGAFGPWMVTSDEIPDNSLMTVETRLNGKVMQSSTTDKMIHSIERQIAYTSTIAPLQPGDVIVTGTPGGVGARRDPPVWMKPGDRVEIIVDKIGILQNTIAAEE